MPFSKIAKGNKWLDSEGLSNSGTPSAPESLTGMMNERTVTLIELLKW